MLRSNFIFRALLIASVVSSSAFVSQANDESQPNIIMLMSDDQGWGDVGFNGNEEIITPHLDEMASSGVTFNRFYAAAPLCSPTRGSCLTGRYPFRYGILAAHTGGMRVGEYTVAEMLGSKGYRTGFFGKWHIGWVRMEDGGSRGFFSPPGQHGFEEWFATTSAVPTFDPGITPKGWSKWGNKKGEPWKGGTPYVHNGEPYQGDITGDDSRIIMDKTIKFIRETKQQPFLATVWFHAPHEPVVASEEHKNMYPDADELKQNYYGCITAMDQQVGRLRTELETLGLAENTIIFFCSDNGPADNMAKKNVASAGKFKGHKHQMYDGGTLVPACAVWPGKILAGTKTNARCSTIDFFPTIANIVDFKFSKNKKRPIDGVDMMPFIEQTETERPRDLFFGYRRLVQGIDGQALIHGDWKLVQEAKKNPRVRLYNIAADPYERKDLAREQPDLLAELKKRMSDIDKNCQLSRDGADYRY